MATIIEVRDTGETRDGSPLYEFVYAPVSAVEQATRLELERQVALLRCDIDILAVEMRRAGILGDPGAATDLQVDALRVQGRIDEANTKIALLPGATP
jgi:hypothetical protein